MAVELVGEGLLSRACTTLLSEPPVPVTPEVVKEMESKHPSPRPTEEAREKRLRKVVGEGTPKLSEDMLKDAIRSFPKGSAPGPSGLKPQHLKDALVPGWTDEVLRHFAELGSKMARGEVHESARPYIVGANLAALKKPEAEGLRPVAAGEAVRRCVAKALWATAKEEAQAVLEPMQLGIGTSMGAEIVVHRIRSWVGRNKGRNDRGLVTVDLSNAFNAIDRSAVREAARRYAPSLVPWVDLCYGKSSWLVLGNSFLKSERGVQQGDPLGPGLFGMGIQRVVEEATRETQALYPGELEITHFYLDDGVAAGTWRSLGDWLRRLEIGFADIGLDMQRSKCNVIPMQTGMKAAEAGNPCAGCEWVESGNFRLLGAAFGSVEFCEGRLRRRTDKARRLMSKIRDLEDPQAALLLLRHCAGYAKVAYSTRTVPTQDQEEALEEYGIALRDAFQAIVRFPVNERGWRQAQLGVASGGLGLRLPQEHGPAAYAASVRAARTKIGEVGGAGDGGMAEADREAMRRMERAAPEGSTMEGPTGKGGQKYFSSLIDTRIRMALLSGPGADTDYKQHIALMTSLGSGAWVHAYPNHECKIEPELFRITVARRLRLKIMEEEVWCPMCGEVMDCFGDHATVCTCNGDRTIRHNRVRNVVNQESKRVGMRTEKEKAGLLPGRPVEDGIATNDQRRPADIWWRDGAGGNGVAWDFAVASGMTSKRIRKGADRAGEVFEEYANFKETYKDTGQKCREQGFEFKPLVLEAQGGGWSTAMGEVLSWIGQRKAECGVEVRTEEAVQQIAQRVSTTLQVENARAILRRLAAAGKEEEEGETAGDDLGWGDVGGEEAWQDWDN